MDPLGPLAPGIRAVQRRRACPRRPRSRSGAPQLPRLDVRDLHEPVQDAIEAATQALTIAAETGDTRQRAWARHYIAWSCLRLGDYARAEQNAREALAFMEAAGDREGYPQALGVLGDSLRGLGRLEEALDCHLGCVTLLQRPD